MKSLATFIFGTLIVFCAWSQESTTVSSDGPVITFEKNSHEFGDIKQGDVIEHVFAFENTGNAPLIITDVQTTCGCTAPEWPRDPIIPGQASAIKVRFNSAGKSGRQNKVITIVSNATQSRTQVSIVTNVLTNEAVVSN